ncbi:MAG: hypothetical protein H7177_13160 [Rhizobacter sp.]|nr:hypothetical protein [Bacteriovorax sp.]
MKKLSLKFILASILTVLLTANSHASLHDYLETKDIPGKVKKEIANLDIQFGADIANIDLIDGINISSKYSYDVEASYQDQFYTRIDKWDLKGAINVGDIVDNFVDLPFSFSVNREQSFFFVRQFKKKKEALLALPYSPKHLPLTADLALKSLNPGDFVSIPANLNVAIEARANSASVTPVVLSANAGVYYVLSGEFIIQVFKIDESHVRLKLISTRGYNRGVSGGAGLSFKLFGIRILDKQIDHLFDRDLVQLGYQINPGAQFIADYIFDLKNDESKEAYDQILKTTLKFKDAVVINKLDNASVLKDKLISSFEKAEKIFAEDKLKEPKDRRISRIFKGFNDFRGDTKKVKFALLVTSYTKDTAYTENKVTFIDKNENNLHFFYPTYSKYITTKFGKWIFDFKDQTFMNNFGLIPRLNTEDINVKNPDFGLSFERRDKLFRSIEQRMVQKYMIGQIPEVFGPLIDMSEWKKVADRTDSRVFFQLILKSQGFKYLSGYSEEQLNTALQAYVEHIKTLHMLDEDVGLEKLKDFLFVNRFVTKSSLKQLASKLYIILENKEGNSEIMLSKLVKLNDHGVFDKIGVGFLISLLPQDQLKDLIYFKLEMTAKKLKPVSFEFGTLNYRALYKELTEVQARITNRSYDLRVTDQDHEMENTSAEEDLYEGIPAPGEI